MLIIVITKSLVPFGICCNPVLMTCDGDFIEILAADMKDMIVGDGPQRFQVGRMMGQWRIKTTGFLHIIDHLAMTWTIIWKVETYSNDINTTIAYDRDALCVSNIVTVVNRGECQNFGVVFLFWKVVNLLLTSKICLPWHNILQN